MGKDHSCVSVEYATGTVLICKVCGQIRSAGFQSHDSLPCDEAEEITKSHDWWIVDEDWRNYSFFYECKKCGVTASQDRAVSVPFYPRPCEPHLHDEEKLT
jgi:hypothetical protein